MLAGEKKRNRKRDWDLILINKSEVIAMKSES